MKQGFTLIELLVVIAIIALLLAIVVPALSKAKTYAEEILCKSNLHQYHIATELYANANKDFYPDPWKSLYKEGNFPGEIQSYCRWHNPLYNLDSYPEYAGPYWPYLAATKANVCPTFAKVASRYASYHVSGSLVHDPAVAIGQVNFSYSMNSIFRKRVNGVSIPVKKTGIRSMSQTFLWAEENMWKLNGLSNQVLNDNALVISSEIVDIFGSFHKISKAQLAQQLPDNPLIGKPYNAGVANVLMADGSSTFLKPTEAERYVGKIN